VPKDSTTAKTHAIRIQPVPPARQKQMMPNIAEKSTPSLKITEKDITFKEDIIDVTFPPEFKRAFADHKVSEESLWK
jgi:hypothetical protein